MDNRIGLVDRNGYNLPNDCIILGSLEGEFVKHYFNIGIKSDGTIEMVACTYGYVHNVSQKDILDFEYIGLAKDNMELLECD